MADKTPKLTKEERRVIAIDKARTRRVASSARKTAQIEWFIEEVSDVVEKTMKQRVQLATELVKSKVVLNISIPVKKETRIWYEGKKRRSRVIVTERSKPGEFPRADTTQLMKTIFGEVKETEPHVFDGFIGTPLDYGLRLETSKKLNRSFLRRTFMEEKSKIFRILTGPIKGVKNKTHETGMGRETGGGSSRDTGLIM